MTCAAGRRRRAVCLSALCLFAVAAESQPAAARPYPWKAHGLWGYVDAKGEWAIKPRFEHAKAFREDGLAEASIQGDKDISGSSGAEKYGLINARGEWVLRPEWDGVKHSSGKAVWVKSNSLWQPAAISGVTAGSISCRDARPYSEGLALTWTGGLFGWVDEEGRWAIPPRFNGGDDFSGGLAPAKKNGKWGYIDSKGDLRIQAAYDKAGPFSGGLARVKADGSWGLIKADGTWAVRPAYDEIDQAAEGLWPMRSGKLWGFLDASGRIAVKPVFKDSSRFSCGLAREKDAASRLWGYVNGSGEWAIRPAYAKADDFSDGLARVKKAGDLLLLDSSGKEIAVRAVR